MRSRLIKRTRRKRKRKSKTLKTSKRGGTFIAEPSYYMKKGVSFFSMDAPVAYGNKANVPPFPYIQSK
jgi:hypothetical protein